MMKKNGSICIDLNYENIETGIFLYLMLISLLSCNKQRHERIECMINAVKDRVYNLDTCIIQELYEPYGLYLIGEDVFVVNRNKSGHIIYRYDRDMVFKRSYFSYGRGENEFVCIDKSIKTGNDSTLFLYTNWFDCTEFSIIGEDMEIENQFPILKEVQNNVILLNDSLLFYHALQQEKPFAIYNYTTHKLMHEFGEFPKRTISYETNIDRDNICLCHSIYEDNRKLLISFYVSIPIIRIYNLETFSLVKEIHITDAKEQVKLLDEYYGGKDVIYFQAPVASGNYIYAAFVNACSGEDMPEYTKLIKIDFDGNIVSTHTLDRFCPIFSISEDGRFYGIALSEEGYVLCRTVL